MKVAANLFTFHRLVGGIVLWTGLACIAALPLLAVGGWGMSYTNPGRVGWAVLARDITWRTKGYQIAIGRGKVSFSCVVIQLWEDGETTLAEFLETEAQPVVGWYHDRLLPDAVEMSCIPVDPFWNHFGIYRTSDSSISPDSDRMTGIVLPFWLLSGLCTLMATPVYLFAYRRHRRRARARRGACPTCGYDLQHSGPICPECGNAKANDV